ncbi:MAG: TlpA disulfide reductase family protein [Planctomycetaceae bacterium]
MNRPLAASGLGRTVLWAAVLGTITGCGTKTPRETGDSVLAKSPDPGEPVNDPSTSPPTPEDEKTGRPPATVDGKQPPLKRATIEPPQRGTPQWYVQQMLLLRFKKYPATDDVQKLRALRRERNLKIVKLAEEAAALTHKDPELQEVFNAVVHQWVEARVRIALLGGRDDILDLYDLAAVLYKRDKTSKAAAEAAYKVALFANTNANRYPDPKMGWLDEFVKRARLFATDFPQEKGRAVRLLDVAGRSCELNRRVHDAIKCYDQIRKQFPDMVQAKYATAVLRRLMLKGRALELSGPAIDGNYIDIKDYAGKVVLVAFWATDRKQCHDVVPKLQTLAKRYKNAGFEVIGVNLDKEEPPVDAFLEKTGITWPQIFHTDRAKRRWDNPIAQYYAIRDLPTLWLVDRRGVTIDTHVQPDTLDARLRQLLRIRSAAKR